MDVLHDVLGPDGSSIAFVSVAVDLVLSHWRECPRSGMADRGDTRDCFELDDARATRDLTGVDRISPFEQEASTARVKRADLDAKPSRRNRLSTPLATMCFMPSRNSSKDFAQRLSKPETRSSRSRTTAKIRSTGCAPSPNAQFA